MEICKIPATGNGVGLDFGVWVRVGGFCFCAPVPSHTVGLKQVIGSMVSTSPIQGCVVF